MISYETKLTKALAWIVDLIYNHYRLKKNPGHGHSMTGTKPATLMLGPSS